MPIYTRFPFIFSITIASLFFLFCAWYFPPFWETNDDSIMAMRAHGFGNMVQASANIQFSNILWGYVVHLMPSFSGILGYSIATALLLIAVLGTLIYAAIEIYSTNNRRLATLVGIIGIVSVAPIIIPQFTVNAGLLACASIFSLKAYEIKKRRRFLLIAFLLLFVGLLVRENMAILTIVAALPLIHWRSMIINKEIIGSSLLLLILFVLSKGLHVNAYSAEEWAAYKELQNARIYWMDFRGFEYLLARPDLYIKYDLTSNDIELLRRWFFADQELNNPLRLTEMKKELHDLITINDRIIKGWASLTTLTNDRLYPLVIIGLLLIALYPNKRVLYAWLIAIIGFFYIGWIGRPGIIRVYTPIIILLVMAPCFMYSHRNFSLGKKYIHAIQLSIVMMVAIHLTYLFNDHKEKLYLHEQIKTDIDHIKANKSQDEYLVTWGHLFPFEIVYPVFERASKFRDLKIYGLGNGTLNPNGLAYDQEKKGNGLVDKILAEESILIYADKHRVNALRIYCAEHYKMKLHYDVISETDAATLYNVRCFKEQSRG